MFVVIKSLCSGVIQPFLSTAFLFAQIAVIVLLVFRYIPNGATSSCALNCNDLSFSTTVTTLSLSSLAMRLKQGMPICFGVVQISRHSFVEYGDVCIETRSLYDEQPSLSHRRKSFEPLLIGSTHTFLRETRGWIPCRFGQFSAAHFCLTGNQCLHSLRVVP